MLYGPGTVSLLDVESSRQVVGLELLFGSGAFWSVLKLTENHRLGAGRSKLMRWGSYAGTLFGLGVPVFFENQERQGVLGRGDAWYFSGWSNRQQVEFSQMV